MIRFTDDEMKALRKLRTMYGCRHWNNAGYFDVPGAVMRKLASEGYCEMRKRSASSPNEYQGTFNHPNRIDYP